MMKARFRSKRFMSITVSFLFFLTCLAVAPLIGSTRIDLSRALNWPLNPDSSPDASILLLARLPRTLLAALAGMALSITGAAFQALLRNPLADPYTLGVASGASFGAVFAMTLGVQATFLGISGVELFSSGGAFLTIYLVFKLAQREGKTSTQIMVLSGVTVSFFFAAMILFMQYLADFTQTYRILHWLMGGLDIAGYGALIHIVPVVSATAVILVILAKNFNLLSAGEESAESRGVNVDFTRKLAYLAGSFVTAIVVSVTGPIGFVGLIVPHAMRFLVGADHRILIPCSIFTGAGFLILCDMISRIAFAPAELPVGVLTAMLGGPFFLILLVRKPRY
jgi:iron complex transport system permease protein